MATRDNLQGINALQAHHRGDYADKLDSNRRNTLVAGLDAYKTSLIQRNEAAVPGAARAGIETKKAGEFGTFHAWPTGNVLTGIHRRAVAATRTPYQAGIVALAKHTETGGIARAIRNQQALLTRSLR